MASLTSFLPSRKFMIVLGALLVGLYVTWCVLLWSLQDRMVFPVDLIAGRPLSPPPANTYLLEHTFAAGQKVPAWLVIPTDDLPPDAPLIVFFHGNAERIDDQGALLGAYRDLPVAVLLIEYRGYGRADGRPNAADIVNDSVELIRTARAHPATPGGPLIFHGRSLGGAIAMTVSEQVQPDAIIVQSTFQSIATMARSYGVPGFLARHHLPAAEIAARLTVPLLVMHGRHDRIIPPDHGRAVADAAGTELLSLWDYEPEQPWLTPLFSAHNPESFPTHRRPICLDAY